MKGQAEIDKRLGYRNENDFDSWAHNTGITRALKHRLVDFKIDLQQSQDFETFDELHFIKTILLHGVAVRHQ